MRSDVPCAAVDLGAADAWAARRLPTKWRDRDGHAQELAAAGASGAILFAIAALWYATASEDGVIDVGDVRQLFTDASRIERRSGVTLELRRPVPREIVLERDRSWEGESLAHASVFRDGGRYRLYYRASGTPAPESRGQVLELYRDRREQRRLRFVMKGADLFAFRFR